MDAPSPLPWHPVWGGFHCPSGETRWQLARHGGKPARDSQGSDRIDLALAAGLRTHTCAHTPPHPKTPSSIHTPVLGSVETQVVCCDRRGRPQPTSPQKCPRTSTVLQLLPRQDSSPEVDEFSSNILHTFSWHMVTMTFMGHTRGMC